MGNSIGSLNHCINQLCVDFFFKENCLTPFGKICTKTKLGLIVSECTKLLLDQQHTNSKEMFRLLTNSTSTNSKAPKNYQKCQPAISEPKEKKIAPLESNNCHWQFKYFFTESIYQTRYVLETKFNDNKIIQAIVCTVWTIMSPFCTKKKKINRFHFFFKILCCNTKNSVTAIQQQQKSTNSVIHTNVKAEYMKH